MKYTFQSYIDSGKYKKRVWWWPTKWYVVQQEGTIMEWKEWDKEDIFFKRNYPVQFFFRETIDTYIRKLRYKFKDIKHDVKGHIINPRKEMRNKVFPHRWNDLTESIVTFHLETLIEFVDREKCFDSINYNSDDHHREFAKGLKECYEYAKITRPSLELKLEEAYKEAPSEGEYLVVYKEVNKITADMKEYDTKVCEWVIKNRDYFWC